MKHNKGKGDDTENLVEKIGGIIFLRDFVIRNPKFRKKNGQEKELTDILVPFEKELISIQAKSKVVNTRNNEQDVLNQRVSKIIENGVGQLVNTRKVVDKGQTLHYKNVHGIDIPLTAENVVNIHGIVVVNIYDHDGSHIRIDSGFTRRHSMPIHIIDVADFYAISNEIDTIPDLIDFLNIRTNLYESNKLLADVSELDLLATYKTLPDVVEKLIADKKGKLAIAPGIWDEYRSGRVEDIKKRNKLNRLSYLVDSTIEQLSGSIGYTPEVKNPSNGRALDPGDTNSYWGTVYELSKLKRLERRVFGNKMHEKMIQADAHGYGYTSYMPSDHEAILFLSLKSKDRQERMDKLYYLASLAYVGKNLTKITAIATESLKGPGRSLDVIVLEGVLFENADELLIISRKMFSNPKLVEGYEYRG